ncbi:DUF998 domain-containing protein [Amycolatopsis sp.]|jgi:hypothetical membrane protein|uniref:DUF998 domain-containing protein n=1 Tax=Amycolatopsis sp. TaxID=37632 RepID=UPI002E096839|nr:DUF998 domain-containing protein [Amycolatopsis sp.]
MDLLADVQRNAVVPQWALVSSLVAPVAMIGGWSIAADRQPGGFDWVRRTISELAGHGAHERWIMTTGLALLGICHLVTAAGLRTAATPGRVLLAIGGAAIIAVAALPLPAHGTSLWHGVAAGVVFVTLSAWPVASGVTAVNGLASAVLTGLLLLFLVELQGGGAYAGATERLLAGAQACCPAVVTLSASARRQAAYS